MRTSSLPDFILPPSVRLARRGWRILAALCLGYGVLSGGMAAAEVVNPATLGPTPTLRQPRPGVGVGVRPEEDALRAPANADKTFITIRSVNVDGAFPELEEQTAALIGEIQGRRVSLAEAYEFARALRDAYWKAGYWLTLVKIPPQNFQSGAIRIVVIDGFIEDIDLSTVPERARDLVRARLEPLVGQRHLTLAEFQRRIILIGDIAGVTGRSAIKKGFSTGGWILTVDVTEKLVSALTSVSNRLPWQVGTWQFSQTASVNNAMGLGEQFYATASSSSDFDRFFDGTSRFMSYGGGGVVPIGIDGLRLGAGYLAVRQLPRPTPSLGTLPIQFAGLYERAYVQASYPLILTLEQSLRVHATYDFTTNILRRRAGSPGFVPPIGFGFDQYRERYSSFGFTAEWAFLFPWAWGGSATNTASYSHGLGGRAADNPLATLVVGGTPLSRPGASSGIQQVLGRNAYLPAFA